MHTNRNVLRKFSRVLTGAGLALLTGTGCLGTDILGFELGPNGSSIFTVTGVLPPNSTCGFTANAPGSGGVYALSGEMEFGTGEDGTGEYVAVFEVVNRQSEPTIKANQGGGQGTYQGKFGSTPSGDIEIIGASVRYDYPDFGISTSPQQLSTRPRSANGPGEGLVRGTSTAAYGVAKPQSATAVEVKIINESLITALLTDPEVVARLENSSGFESFDVVAYVTFEGRTMSGSRITSSEGSYRVTMSRGRIRNCDAADSACDANRPDPMVPRRAVRQGQCYRDQDIPECSTTACEDAT